MDIVEARNALESYVYNFRNTVNEDKSREKMGAEFCDEYVEKTKKYIEWLDANPSAEKAEYEAKKKESEDDFRPFLLKLYGADAPKEAGETVVPEPTAAPGPKVEEVD
jgi:L1 cell adhesion molecule like protein